MSKISYQYDHKTATYIPIQKNRSQQIIGITILGLLFLSLGIMIGKFYITETNDTESKAQQDIKLMERQYEELENQMIQLEKSLVTIKEKDNHLYRTFFQMDTLTEEERNGGIGGSDRYKKFKNIKKADLIISVSERFERLKHQLKVQENSLSIIKNTAKNKQEELLHIPAIQPIVNKDLKKLASGFGHRRHPILGISKMHEGIDFTASTGTPIYATANGIVKEAGVKGGYGNTVIIDHKYGYETLYAHMSKIKIRKGATIKRGDVIGYVGSTGMSSGPHLHYEIKKDGEKIDPISYFYQDLSTEEFNKIKQISTSFDSSWD